MPERRQEKRLWWVEVAIRQVLLSQNKPKCSRAPGASVGGQYDVSSSANKCLVIFNSSISTPDPITLRQNFKVQFVCCCSRPGCDLRPSVIETETGRGDSRLPETGCCSSQDVSAGVLGRRTTVRHPFDPIPSFESVAAPLHCSFPSCGPLLQRFQSVL